MRWFPGMPRSFRNGVCYEEGDSTDGAGSAGPGGVDSSADNGGAPGSGGSVGGNDSGSGSDSGGWGSVDPGSVGHSSFGYGQNATDMGGWGSAVSADPGSIGVSFNGLDGFSSNVGFSGITNGHSLNAMKSAVPNVSIPQAIVNSILSAIVGQVTGPLGSLAAGQLGLIGPGVADIGIGMAQDAVQGMANNAAFGSLTDGFSQSLGGPAQGTTGFGSAFGGDESPATTQNMSRAETRDLAQKNPDDAAEPDGRTPRERLPDMTEAIKQIVGVGQLFQNMPTFTQLADNFGTLGGQPLINNDFGKVI